MNCHDCHQSCQNKRQKLGGKLFGFGSKKSAKNTFSGESQTTILGDSYNHISRRALALLLLQKDPILRSQLEQEPYFPEIERIITEIQASMSESLLVDRLFKTIGLSGRSIIPLILGLGCGTMATLVTRTLESKKERIIATLLLALTIPCSAQLGVILGLLSQEPTALFVWATVIVTIFLGIGFLAGKILPGNTSCFYMEIPPLRLPRTKAILTKAYVRLTIVL